MRNKARNTHSPYYLDEIPEGCLIDGSHHHSDDFSVMVIRYAEALGREIDNTNLVAVMLRETGLGEEICTPEGLGTVSEYLTEESDRAVDWLNEHVASEGFAFYVRESDLFLEPQDDEDGD